MNIQINIKDKQVGEPDENGNITTNVDVTFTFDDYSTDVIIPIFNPQTDDEILIGVLNRCGSEVKKYQNGIISIN